MSVSIYKIIHVAGAFLALGSLFALNLRALGGGGAFAQRKRVMATHGAGMALVLVAGFGMLARLGIQWPYPAWVWLKFLFLAILGWMPVLIARRPGWAGILWWVVPLLGALSTALAVYKPF